MFLQAVDRLARGCRPAKEAKDLDRESLESMGCSVAGLRNIRDVPKDQLCNTDYITGTLGECLSKMPCVKDIVSNYMAKHILLSSGTAQR